MANEVRIAAAGGGKTTKIAARACEHASGRVAIVTYTTNNVEEIRSKCYGHSPALPAHAEIWSWFRFLIHEMARPYQSALIKGRIEGLHWVEGRSDPYAKHTDTMRYYFSGGMNIYSDKVARFVIDCNELTHGAVVARLEERFDTIFIDEIQDMAGYDIDLLEIILKSRINLVMVGDHRQATFSTNNALKNKPFAGFNIIKKFREWDKKKLLTLSYDQETHRCHQLIADLADAFYPDDPKTISKNGATTDHDGVFVLSKKDVPTYVDNFSPQILRLDRRVKCDGYPAMNFGEAKGLTFDRVLIFPHKKGAEWLKTGNLDHVKDSAAKMYVGITRARHSVVFVYDGEVKVPGLDRLK